MISSLIQEQVQIDAMRATPGGLRRLRTKAPALVLKCQKYPAMMRDEWDAIQKMASKSAWPVDDLKPFFSAVLSMIDLCLAMTTALHAGLEAASAAADHLSSLDEVTTSLESLRAEVSGVWDTLTAPPVKRTLRTTAEIRAGRARGEYISIEEPITEAGGKVPGAP